MNNTQMKKQSPEPTSNNLPHVIDGQSPSSQYVWIGDQYLPVESLI